MKKWTPKEIKDLRTKLKLSQEGFGNFIGVTREYVNYLEKGRRNPGETLKILLSRIKQNSNK